MTSQQQSFLPPDTRTAPASSGLASALPKLNAKSLSRLSIVFGTFGAVAFLQNAGFGSGLLGRPHSPDNESGGGGRSLTLENEDVQVTAIDERVLQVAVNGLTEGYYTDKSAELGPGVCVDSYNPARGYDYTRFYEIDAAKCANRCAGSLLLSEHRGFNYDDSTNDCCCLYDDHRIPLSEQRKAPEYNVENNGVGPVAATDGSKPSYKCYVKEAAALGTPTDSYQLELCSDDGAERDVVTFSDVWDSSGCAEKCLRFKLFATHMGFTHQTEQCACLFQRGEAPSVRKLTGSGGSRKARMTYEERLEDMGDPDEAKCWSKKQLQSASAGNRLQADTSQRVWINEFHYRNEGINEPFIEVIGPKGQPASDYQVLVYQGRNGAIHRTISLTGNFESAAAGDWGYVTVDLTSPDIRKGKQGGDGLGLARLSDNTCLQLISYTDAEGVDRSFEAKQGACANVAADPIGVFEERGLPTGVSLQLSGTGNTPSVFTWSAPGPATKGSVNSGQTLTNV